jgi:hypothetical protein
MTVFLHIALLANTDERKVRGDFANIGSKIQCLQFKNKYKIPRGKALIKRQVKE